MRLVALLCVCLAWAVSADSRCFDTQKCYNFNHLLCSAPEADTDDSHLCLGRRHVFSTETRPIPSGLGNLSVDHNSKAKRGFFYIELDPEVAFHRYKNAEYPSLGPKDESPAAAAVEKSQMGIDENSASGGKDKDNEDTMVLHDENSASGGKDKDNEDTMVLHDAFGGEDEEATVLRDGQDVNDYGLDDDVTFELRKDATELSEDQDKPTPAAVESHLPKVLLSDLDVATVRTIKEELAVLIDKLKAIDSCPHGNPEMEKLISEIKSLKALKNADLSTFISLPAKFKPVLPTLQDDNEWKVMKFGPCTLSGSCQGIGEGMPEECRVCTLEVLLPKTEPPRRIKFRVHLAKDKSADPEYIGCIEAITFMGMTTVVDAGVEMRLDDMVGSCRKLEDRSVGLMSNFIPELDPRNLLNGIQPKPLKPPKPPIATRKTKTPIEEPKSEDKDKVARAFCVKELRAIGLQNENALPAAFKPIDWKSTDDKYFEQKIERLLVFASSKYEEHTLGLGSTVVEIISFHLMGHFVQRTCEVPPKNAGKEYPQYCFLMIDDIVMEKEQVQQRPAVWASVPFTPQAVIDNFNLIRLDCTDVGTSPLNIHGFRVTDVKISATRRAGGFKYLQYDFMIEDIPIAAVLKLKHKGEQFESNGDPIQFGVGLPSQLKDDKSRDFLFFSDPLNDARRKSSICQLPPQNNMIPKSIDSLMLPELSDRNNFEAVKASINRYRTDHCKLVPIPHHFFRLLLPQQTPSAVRDKGIPVAIGGQDYFAKYDAVHGQLVALYKVDLFTSRQNLRTVSVCDLQPLITASNELSLATAGWDATFKCLGTTEDVVYSKYYPKDAVWNLIQRSANGYRSITIDGRPGPVQDITPQQGLARTIEEKANPELAEELKFLRSRARDAEGSTELFLTALNRVRSGFCKASRISREQLSSMHVMEWSAQNLLRGSFVVDTEDLYSFEIDNRGLQYMKFGRLPSSNGQAWCQDVRIVKPVPRTAPVHKPSSGKDFELQARMERSIVKDVEKDLPIFQEMFRKTFECRTPVQNEDSRQEVLLRTACYVGCGNVDMEIARTVALTAVHNDGRWTKYAATLQVLHASYTVTPPAKSRRWRIKFVIPPMRHSVLYFEFVEGEDEKSNSLKAYKWGAKASAKTPVAVDDVNSSSKKIILSVLEEARKGRAIWIRRWIIENCGCQDKIDKQVIGDLTIPEFLPPCKIRAVIETVSSQVALYALQVNLNREVTPNKWFLQHFVSVTGFQMPFNLRWDSSAFNKFTTSVIHTTDLQRQLSKMDHIVRIDSFRYCLMIHDRDEKKDPSLFDCSDSVVGHHPLPSVTIVEQKDEKRITGFDLDPWFYLRSFFIEFNAARRKCLLRPIRQVGPITEDGDRLLVALNTGSFLNVRRFNLDDKSVPEQALYFLWAGHPCHVDQHDFDTQALADYNTETLLLINERLQNMRSHILRSSILQWKISFEPFTIKAGSFVFGVEHTWDILFQSPESNPAFIPDRLTLLRLSRDHRDKIEVLPFAFAAPREMSNCVPTKEHPLTIRTDLCTAGVPSAMASWLLVCGPGELSAAEPSALLSTKYSAVLHFMQAHLETLTSGDNDGRVATMLKLAAEIEHSAVQWEDEAPTVCNPFANVDRCKAIISPSSSGGVQWSLVRALQKIVAAGFSFGPEDGLKDFVVRGAPKQIADGTMTVSLVVPSYHEALHFVDLQWDLQIEARKCELEGFAFVQKTNKLAYSEAVAFRNTKNMEEYFTRDFKPASLTNTKLCALWKSQCEMAMKNDLTTPPTEVDKDVVEKGVPGVSRPISRDAGRTGEANEEDVHLEFALDKAALDP